MKTVLLLLLALAAAAAAGLAVASRDEIDRYRDLSEM
jgi:hypothetical protein